MANGIVEFSVTQSTALVSCSGWLCIASVEVDERGRFRIMKEDVFLFDDVTSSDIYCNCIYYCFSNIFVIEKSLFVQ